MADVSKRRFLHGLSCLGVFNLKPQTHEIVYRFFTSGHICVFFWGHGPRFPPYSQSYLNPQIIDSISAWNPYTMTEANKLRDTGFFQVQIWLWNNGPAPLLAATWRWALLVACWVNATLCLQNNVALSEWSITWKPGWVPDLLQYCHILMRCCNLTLKPTGRESGDSLHFPWICPFRFQRNPSQVQVSCWQCLGRNS